MLPKAILFFLIIIFNDVESPNNNQHDREFQQHCELFTNEYLKTAEKMKTNQLREQLSTYALSKLKFVRILHTLDLFCYCRAISIYILGQSSTRALFVVKQ